MLPLLTTRSDLATTPRQTMLPTLIISHAQATMLPTLITSHAQATMLLSQITLSNLTTRSGPATTLRQTILPTLITSHARATMLLNQITLPNLTTERLTLKDNAKLWDSVKPDYRSENGISLVSGTQSAADTGMV